MLSYKKFTCKGTLRQVFIRFQRLETQSVMLVFRPSFVNCCPSNLLSGSSPPRPLPCVNIEWVYCVHIYCTVCKGWGIGVPGLRQINTGRKVPLQVIFYHLSFYDTWSHLDPMCPDFSPRFLKIQISSQIFLCPWLWEISVYFDGFCYWTLSYKNNSHNCIGVRHLS
jgi:hypothetical protein